MGATAFPAAAIVSGTIATPRLGSGTADATSFLRGDSTWAVVPEVTRASLGLATTDSPTFAGATVGEGTFEARTIKLGVDHFVRRGTYNGEVGIGNSGGNFFYANGNTKLFMVGSTGGIGWKSSLSGITGDDGIDLQVTRDAANTLAQRNGTNGQKSRLYKTYTSATSGEWLELDAATNASNFDIAASIGSAGGTARGIRIGGKNAAGTFTSWMSFATSGTVAIPVLSAHVASVTGYLYTSGFGVMLGYQASTVRLSSVGGVLWSINTNAADTIDTGLQKSAAGVLQVTNGVVGTLRDLALRDLTASGTINARTGTATAGTAPIKLTAGTNLTTPEAGAIEYDGTNLYFTDSGGVRRQLAVV